MGSGYNINGEHRMELAIGVNEWQFARCRCGWHSAPIEDSSDWLWHARIATQSELIDADRYYTESRWAAGVSIDECEAEGRIRIHPDHPAARAWLRHVCAAGDIAADSERSATAELLGIGAFTPERRAEQVATQLEEGRD